MGLSCLPRAVPKWVSYAPHEGVLGGGGGGLSLEEARTALSVVQRGALGGRHRGALSAQQAGRRVQQILLRRFHVKFSYSKDIHQPHSGSSLDDPYMSYQWTADVGCPHSFGWSVVPSLEVGGHRRSRVGHPVDSLTSRFSFRRRFTFIVILELEISISCNNVYWVSFNSFSFLFQIASSSNPFSIAHYSSNSPGRGGGG